MVYRWDSVTAGESELPCPVNFLSSVGPETRVVWSELSERGPAVWPDAGRWGGMGWGRRYGPDSPGVRT